MSIYVRYTRNRTCKVGIPQIDKSKYDENLWDCKMLCISTTVVIQGAKYVWIHQTFDLWPEKVIYVRPSANIKNSNFCKIVILAFSNKSFVSNLDNICWPNVDQNIFVAKYEVSAFKRTPNHPCSILSSENRIP